jgi:hypothetical protein
VVTILMRAPFEVRSLSELMPLHEHQLDDGQSLQNLALQICKQVCDSLRDVLLQSSPPTEPEAYTAFCFTDLGQVENVQAWLEEEVRAVAGLLAQADPERLSEQQIQEVLRIQRAFEKGDLVVIDWDAALIVDLTGYVEDTLYVLELANLQLEEFRVMDLRLDRYLDRAYGDLERRPLSLFGFSSPVLRALREFRVDVTRLADEVTHITKFFGDWYLARVYLGVRERFHLDSWRNSVERRLLQLDQLYTVFQTELNERRMLWLEFLIVVFFAIDLVVLFLRK